MQPDTEDIDRFLSEDIGAGDLTADIIAETKHARATLITRESMVLCGQAWFDAIFHHLDKTSRIEWLANDGDQVAAGERLCEIEAGARAMLTGERTALNLLQTLSATASLARRYADAVTGTGCKILDTRKTIPGLRLAQKYAVRRGGCHNHRIGLFDGILIKENHIIAAGSIGRAVSTARSDNPGILLEVEVETLEELEQALKANADRVLLDNFSTEALRQAVSATGGRAELEASGNVTLETVRNIAKTGIDYISVGALTKNIRAIDLSMRIAFSD